jgi:hypothetical protein
VCHILPARQDNTNAETDESPSVCRILTHVLSVAVVRNQSARGSASKCDTLCAELYLQIFSHIFGFCSFCLCHSGMHLSTGQPEETI